ncbi:MAG: hypothetical protein IKJ75_00385 [Clostridia bacterium]|nr:hypothetical protein [Clostridia bacterium]
MKKNYILKIALLFVVIALVSGIYTFIVIPSVRKDMQKQFDEKIAMQLKSYRQVLVYNGATPLLEGSVITEVNRENFTLIQMAKDAITSNYVTSFDDVIGCEVKYTICSGQQVSYENFTDFISTNDADERLKEFKIAGLVAEHAMIGNYVDIIVSYADGYDVVVPKVQIYDIAIDGEHGEYIRDDEGKYTIVVSITEAEHNDLIHASNDGILDIRIYHNEKQEPSVKTYYHVDY